MSKKRKITIIEFPCECPHRFTFGYDRYQSNEEIIHKGSYCHHKFGKNILCKDPDRFPKYCPLDDFHKNTMYCWDKI